MKKMVPTTFYILVEGNTIEVDSQSMESDLGIAEEVLNCGVCDNDFKIPDEFDTTWA